MNDQRSTTTAFDSGQLRDANCESIKSAIRNSPSATELGPLLARRELWLLVSVAFVDPHNRQRFELLRDPAFRQDCHRAAALLAQEHAVMELGIGEADPRRLSAEELFAALDAQAEIETVYRQVFGLTAVSLQCPPCETEWEPNTDVFYRCQQLADIAGFYRAFGLEVSTHCGERLDHITVEAEFLYVLLAKEAAAMFVNPAAAQICWDARRKFFQEHVGWWLPAFAQRLSHVAPPGYYVTLATLTAALSAAERLSLGLPPLTARVRLPLPSGG